MWRDNLTNSAWGELYEYDNLNQLMSMDRGTLNGAKTGLAGSASRSQDWSFDALGNFTGVTSDGVTTNRTHNRQNEVTAVGSNNLTFDANGNLLTDENGQQYVYDAWNRLVKVKNSSGTTIAEYEYDGQHRRISQTVSGTTTDYYYSASWQVLEERVSGATRSRYVWSPVYIDALILRDRDADSNGTLEERLWAVQGANYNVTALVDGAGNVVERYAYDAFGQVTVLDANYNTRSSSSYAWVYLWQGLRRDAPSRGPDVIVVRSDRPMVERSLDGEQRLSSVNHVIDE